MIWTAERTSSLTSSLLGVGLGNDIGNHIFAFEIPTRQAHAKSAQSVPEFAQACQ